MKKIIKILTSCFLVIGIMFINTQPADAAGLSVSVSSSSVAVGSTVTVTVRASGNVFVEGLSISCSGGHVSGLSRASIDKGESATASFTLTSSSGGYVSVSGNAANYDTEQEYGVSGGCSIKVKSSNSSSSSSNTSRPAQEPQDDPRSKNNNLKSLSISQGTLNPKFSASQTEYSVSLSADVTEITVDAKADDSKAKVSGTGKQSLKAGKNDIKIVCTSEYGTKKEYIIHATVDEKPLIYLDYNDAKLGVVRNYDGIQVPDGFKETTVKVQDHETKVWVNADMKKTIIYLMDEDNQKNFYLYDDGKVESMFKPITISGMKLYMVDIDEKTQKREGMTYTEIEVDKQKMMGWTFQDKSFENYMLIYVMDTTGEMKDYQYEKTTNTLQPYSHAAPVTDAAYQKSIQSERTQKMIFMGLSGLLAIVIVGGVIYYFKKIKNV